ncbi:hypothetical protein Sjap_022006 [Stephania japonica]|uniref:PPM-type phosphatase domain-containing protein n=1 Tax=Stephania japonica TaxID=461633 RepID=A0AAP0HSC9_9MAGN
MKKKRADTWVFDPGFVEFAVNCGFRKWVWVGICGGDAAENSVRRVEILMRILCSFNLNSLWGLCPTNLTPRDVVASTHVSKPVTRRGLCSGESGNLKWLSLLEENCFVEEGTPSYGSGKGRSHQGPVKFGYSLVKGRANHPMEDFHVAKFVETRGHELGLFAIYDGHLGDSVLAYLQKHLFSNILKEAKFWTDTTRSIAKAYETTDQAILSHTPDLGRVGSTAVTAILVNGEKLWIKMLEIHWGVLSERRAANTDDDRS